MISAVFLNWQRMQQLPNAMAGPFNWTRVTEILVWNNNPDQRLHFPKLDGPEIVVINSGRNFSCWTRYAVALLAKNDTLLFHDDDLALSPENLELLFKAHQRHPNQIVGPFARNLQPCGTLYNEQGQSGRIATPHKVDVILGRVSMFHRSLLLRALPHMQPPYTIDDDVAFSLAATKATGLKHYAAPVGPIRDLCPDDEHASYTKPGFKETRNQTALNLR